MKILLINPPYSRLKGLGQAPYFPLGLGCLARAVPDSHEVRILNLENSHPDEKEFPIDKETVYRFRSQSYAAYLNALKDQSHPAWQELMSVLGSYKPDLVGITVMTVDVGASAKITALVKAWDNTTPVIWGGVHPTFETESCLEEKGVDFVIRGEGELALQSFLNAYSADTGDFSLVPGLSYKKNNTLRHNNLPELIKDIDDFFPPRRDVDFFPERYTSIALGSIMASRGCPWQCSFCSSPVFWQRRLRYRQASLVFDEIKDLVDRGITRHFTFWDDSFTANAQKVRDLCELLIKNSVKITWKTATRIDLLDESLLDLMCQAGCIQLQIGIETGSHRMAKILKKEIDPFKSIEAVKKIKGYGIGSGAFFMAGFHNETEEDLHQTYDLMKQLDTDEIVLNVFDPMPGSESFNEMKELNLFSDPIDWKDFPLWPDKHFAEQIPEDKFNSILEDMSSWIFRYNNRPDKKWHKNKLELKFLLFYDRPYLVKKFLNYFLAILGRFKRFLPKIKLLLKSSVHFIKYLFWMFGTNVLKFVPLTALYFCGDILGSIFSRINSKRSKLIRNEFKELFEAKIGPQQLAEASLESFTNFTKEIFELFHYPTFTDKEIKKFISLEGFEHLETALAKGNGAILLTAHFGAHLMPILGLKQYNLDIYQLGTPPSAWEEMIGKSVGQFEKKIFTLRNQQENSLPATFVFLKSSMREVFRILEKNSVLIVAFDGRGGTKWRKMDFMGRFMNISPGPFHLAYKSNAPIIPVFTIRNGLKNDIIMHAPIYLDNACSKKSETTKALKEFLSIFKNHFVTRPGHYGWLLQAAKIRSEHDPWPLFVDMKNSKK